MLDSATIDSVAKVYEVADYQPFLRARKTKTTLSKDDTIPNFYAVNHLDSLVSLRDYSDKVLYVNFWATWCKPCIKNIPELNTMIAAYDDRDDILFLNICLESDKDKWLTSIKRYDLKGSNLLAEGQW